MKNFAALLEPSTVVGIDSRLTSGKEKLDSIIKIERATKTFIELDKVYRQAKIYGTEPNKKKARVKLTKLMAEMQSSENLIINQTISLEGKEASRSLCQLTEFQTLVTQAKLIHTQNHK